MRSELVTARLVQLSPAHLVEDERAHLVARRKELYEALHPETRPSAEGGTGGRGNRRKVCDQQNVIRFTAATARATGMSERAVVAAKLANMRQGERTDIPAIAGRSVSQTRAAAMLNVSADSVGRARAVIDRGAPELVALVEQGEVAVSATSHPPSAIARGGVSRDAEGRPGGQDERGALACEWYYSARSR